MSVSSFYIDTTPSIISGQWYVLSLFYSQKMSLRQAVTSLKVMQKTKKAPETEPKYPNS